MAGHRLTEGLGDSLEKLGDGCREISECLHSAHVVSQTVRQRQKEPV